jgi:hypothetical protein
MIDRISGALLVWPFALCSTSAVAQIGATPSAHQAELAAIIRQAGYDCRVVESVTSSPSPDPAFATLRPEVATCTNGKKFLVVKSARGGVNAKPIVRPMPADA